MIFEQSIVNDEGGTGWDIPHTKYKALSTVTLVYAKSFIPYRLYCYV